MSGPCRELSAVELTLRSDRRSVAQARKMMGEYAALAGANRTSVELAVSEAVANAVIHAFTGRDGGTITVRARAEAESVLIEVADSGRGIAAGGRFPGLGFGLPMIGELANSVEIQTGKTGTRIALRFACTA
jgi:anti-sigma regulatory factor (Ser/Thr protein kinase)